MRTDQEIQAEIKKLEAFKEQVPSHTFFGESNLDALNAQIETLENQLTEDDIYSREESGDWTEREREHAIEASEWLEDDREQLADDPQGWLSIIRNAKKK